MTLFQNVIFSLDLPTHIQFRYGRAATLHLMQTVVLVQYSGHLCHGQEIKGQPGQRSGATRLT